MLDKQADRRNRVRQRDNTKEASISKILIPIGPFRYGEISHALSDGLDPPRIGRGHGRGCRCYPDDTGEPPTEGGAAHHATTDQYPLTKALPGLAGIGLHNWGVECTAHTGIPSRRGWSDQLVR